MKTSPRRIRYNSERRWALQQMLTRFKGTPLLSLNAQASSPNNPNEVEIDGLKHMAPKDQVSPTDPLSNPKYWQGYLVGLRSWLRFPQFSEEQQEVHKARSSATEIQAQGYNDAFTALTTIDRRKDNPGRPSHAPGHVLTYLDRISIRADLADAMKNKAKDLGLSMADFRRKCYEESVA